VGGGRDTSGGGAHLDDASEQQPKATTRQVDEIRDNLEEVRTDRKEKREKNLKRLDEMRNNLEEGGNGRSCWRFVRACTHG
jgi:L-lactate utilization protein LutB